MFMNSPPFRFTGSMIVVASALLAMGCASPATSRTGAIHSIRVVEGPEPSELDVIAGDEVRWVNGRTLPITVDLVEIRSQNLSCQRGFSRFLRGFQESTTVEPNQTASVCFKEAGVVHYNLRMGSALPGGKDIVSGVVRVGAAR